MNLTIGALCWFQGLPFLPVLGSLSTFIQPNQVHVASGDSPVPAGLYSFTSGNSKR